MSLTDCRGVPVSSVDRDAIDSLDRHVEDSLSFTGDPVGDVTELLSRYPDFVMGHCFKAGLLTQTMEVRVYKEMLAAVEAAEGLAHRANDREKSHIKAVRAWVDGDFFGAVQHWETALTHYPFDLLALQFVHLTDVLLGDVVGQRDSVARLFNLWDESMPGYEFVLGFYAFGLEENHDFSQAEELGRRAVAMRASHPYAIHAVAHVMEMQGRQGGGISWMTRRESDWAQSHFNNHLWWHTALYYLDLGQRDRVMAVYDDHLRCVAPQGNKYEELDAAALLWRVHLLGIDVGSRWDELADKWAPSATDTLYAFNDVHAMMAFAAAGRFEAAQRLLGANERYVDHATDANVAMSRIIGLPFCRALQDFAKGEYGACVDHLLPVRYKAHRLGGSFAQRDVIGWTLLESAIRSRRGDLALALANERCALKPTSPLNWKMVARVHKLRGEVNMAQRAEAKSTSLLAA